MFFTLLYNLPLFALGLLWLCSRWRESRQLTRWRWCLDCAVLSLSLARFFGASLPPSGHAFFLSYSGLTTPERAYQISAAALLLLTIIVKLSWGDSSSWLWGIMAGCACGSLWRGVFSNKHKEKRR